MNTSNRRPNALQEVINAPVLSAAELAETKRRKLHRELSQQDYLIIPMNGPDRVGDHEIISFEELLVLVSQFNKGELPHCDDWFSIEDIEEKRYPIETFYQFIK